MLNIGFTEIIIILVVALVVFGPEKIPEIAKVVGKGYREFRKLSSDVRSELTLDEPFTPPRQSFEPGYAEAEKAGEGKGPSEGGLPADMGPPRSPEAREEMECDEDLESFVDPDKPADENLENPSEKNQSGK